MNRLEGKVALITGAARGQGRSHAVRLAEEGADVIAIDICEPIETAYATATEEDLAETVAQVERLDRRIVAKKADVRDRPGLRAAIADAVGELGRLDVVSINAGIASIAPALEVTDVMWRDMIDVNLTGAWNTAVESIPHILEGGRGGSVIVTASTGSVKPIPNLSHYTAAKHAVLGMTQVLAVELADRNVRVNALCPTGVDTPMMLNDSQYRLFMPDRENPTRADAETPGSPYFEMNLLPIPWVDPVDVSNAIVFLASEEGRYITGITLPIDAGYLIK
jgi:SDR family mycofactocin-dependent oxidoreductase